MNANTHTADPITTDEGVTYRPWSNGHAVGFQATHPDGRTEYVYLNPCGQAVEGDAEVCLYQGTTGHPFDDSPRQFFELFAAGGDTPYSPERAEFLADMITTAVEGGIGYWSTVSEYGWYCPQLGDGTTAPGPGGTATAHATIHDDDAEEGIHIGLDEIDRALRRLAVEPVEGIGKHQRRSITRAYIANDHTETDLDADDADAVVQVACLGSVVYG